MFEQRIKMPYIARRLKKLSDYRDLLNKCAEHLILNRYSHSSIAHYSNALEHFVYWVKYKKSGCQINKGLTEEFINKHIPVCRCPTPCPRGINDLRPALNLVLQVQYNEYPNAINLPESISDIDSILNEFRDYLIHVCGLATRTCLYHDDHIKIFLKYFFKCGKVNLDKLNPTNVCNFVYERLQHYKRKTLGGFIYSLRSFFKFLQFKGIGNSQLIASLPKVVEWKSSALPEYLNKNELSKFFSVIEQNTALGKRDYAMIVCMLELGLRAGEVANLKLSDIDWRNKILYLPRGKTGQAHLSPMTPLVINAIIKYLKYGRPQTASRQVFVYHRAPVGKGIISKVVTDVARKYFICAGLKPIRSGAHILRKTFATNLLHHGATIKEIADLLRHRSINITNIYTKVDFQKLSQVALPWPEEF